MSETMTPKELMELADSEAGEIDHNPRVVAALCSYAELVSALKYLDGDASGFLRSLSYNLATENVSGPGLVAFARECGWPGLEEL